MSYVDSGCLMETGPVLGVKTTVAYPIVEIKINGES